MLSQMQLENVALKSSPHCFLNLSGICENLKMRRFPVLFLGESAALSNDAQCVQWLTVTLLLRLTHTRAAATRQENCVKMEQKKARVAAAHVLGVLCTS